MWRKRAIWTASGRSRTRPHVTPSSRTRHIRALSARRRFTETSMIHVCSLARLHTTVEETGASHVVTLLKDTHLVSRPHGIAAERHLILTLDDICDPLDGYVCPAEDHVGELIDFVRAWDRGAPM